MTRLIQRLARALATNLSDGQTHFHPGTGVPFPCADPACAAARAGRRTDGG